MNDVLTYCPDTAALVTELQEKFPERLYIDEGTGSVSYLIAKTPTVRKGNETLSLVRVSDADLADMRSLSKLTVLGTYEEVFSDPFLKDVYDRVYPRTVVVIDGGEELTLPEKIGEFL